MYLQIVFNRYLAETRRADDLDVLTALPFFLSMRAAIPKVMPGAVIVRSDIERKALFGIAETEKHYPCGHPHPPASSRRGLSGGARARASTVLPVPERPPTAMSSGAGERRFSSAEGLESEFQFAALGLLRGDNQDERASRLNVSVATPSEISSISCFSQLDAPP
jgi:hypothetical protein